MKRLVIDRERLQSILGETKTIESAARALGVSRRTLYRALQEYGLKRQINWTTRENPQGDKNAAT